MRDTPTTVAPSTGTSNDKVEKHDTNSNGGAIPRPSDSSPNTEKKDTRTEPVKPNSRPTYTPTKKSTPMRTKPAPKPAPAPSRPSTPAPSRGGRGG